MKVALYRSAPGVALVLFLFSACTKETNREEAGQKPVNPVELKLSRPVEPLNGREAMNRADLDAHFLDEINRNGVYQWQNASDYLVWSAAVATDSIVSIGYQPEGYKNLDASIHQVDGKDPQWRAVQNALISFIRQELASKYPEVTITDEVLFPFGEKSLPYINVRIWDYETLARLRNFSVVRYLEPMGYGFGVPAADERSSGSGCGNNQGIANVPAQDFVTAPQGAEVSWNFLPMRIHKAWQTSKGEGITLGLIDTGISPDQNKLNSEFSVGFSSGRTVEKVGLFEDCFLFIFCENDGPNDQCGHGTNMAGTLCAPFSADGSMAGVAFKSNLVSVRASSDVVFELSNEKDGVASAYTYLGGRSDVDIISMSLGDLFSSSQITDAINFAYNNGKMIFNAAGTSFSFTTFVGVIFPANLPNTLAVTGIKTGNTMQKCSDCHSGPEVDFTVIMEDKNNSNRKPLTLAQSGNDPTYTGGSSVATATAAGIAALVWATNPAQSREQVLEALKQSGNFYPNRNAQFGWGRINAEVAVGG